MIRTTLQNIRTIRADNISPALWILGMILFAACGGGKQPGTNHPEEQIITRRDKTCWIQISAGKTPDGYRLHMMKRKVLPVKTKGIFSPHVDIKNIPSGKWIVTVHSKDKALYAFTIPHPLIEHYEAPGGNGGLNTGEIHHENGVINLRFPYTENADFIIFEEKTKDGVQFAGKILLQ